MKQSPAMAIQNGLVGGGGIILLAARCGAMKTKSQSRGGKGVKPIGLAGSTAEVDLAGEVGKSGQVGKRNKERASERGTGNVNVVFL